LVKLAALAMAEVKESKAAGAAASSIASSYNERSTLTVELPDVAAGSAGREGKADVPGFTILHA